MRHRKRGRHLGRTPAHRKALRRNLACSLIFHERVRTTPQKAKEVQPFVERLITLARRGSLAHFRRALALLDDKRMVRKLFRELGPRFSERAGGYTRILHLADEQRRLGDGARQVIFELIGAEEPVGTPAAADAGKSQEKPQAEPAEETPAAEETRDESEEETAEDENENTDDEEKT